jgi:hypothetical protein
MFRTVLLTVVGLCGGETWCVTFREKHRLRAFKNRVLRKIFGPERDKVMGVEKTA